jgi:hypothetical protein
MLRISKEIWGVHAGRPCDRATPTIGEILRKAMKIVVIGGTGRLKWLTN